MENYKLIYHYLYSKGLTEDKVLSNGMKKTPEDLFTIKKQLLELIQDQEIEEQTELDIMPNSALSGESLHFNNFPERQERIENLLSSTLLYADKIWIKNPLDNYINRDVEYFSEAWNKEVFLKDILILYLFRDSLESGFVKICKTETHFCRYCLKESFDQIPSDYQKKLDNLEQAARTRFKKGANFTAYEENGKYLVSIDAKEKDLFYEDNLILEYSEPSDFFKNALERKNGKIHQKELHDSYLIRCDFANPILDDIVMHEWYSSQQKLSYYTDRKIDLELIELLNGEEVNQTSNKLIKGLQHNFPAIINIPSYKLIELRQKCPEEFKNYRDTLERVLRQSNELNSKELLEIVKDEIQPEINSIDVLLKKNKRNLGTGIITNFSFCLGSIIVGLKGGFLPTAANSALAALGISNHGGQTVKNIVNYFNRENEISDNKYYFLWKLLNN